MSNFEFLKNMHYLRQRWWKRSAPARNVGRRPMMFTTNGFETYFWDDKTSPQRPVSGIFGVY